MVGAGLAHSHYPFTTRTVWHSNTEPISWAEHTKTEFLYADSCSYFLVRRESQLESKRRAANNLPIKRSAWTEPDLRSSGKVGHITRKSLPFIKARSVCTPFCLLYTRSLKYKTLWYEHCFVLDINMFNSCYLECFESYFLCMFVTRILDTLIFLSNNCWYFWHPRIQEDEIYCFTSPQVYPKIWEPNNFKFYWEGWRVLRRHLPSKTPENTSSKASPTENTPTKASPNTREKTLAETLAEWGIVKKFKKDSYLQRLPRHWRYQILPVMKQMLEHLPFLVKFISTLSLLLLAGMENYHQLSRNLSRSNSLMHPHWILGFSLLNNRPNLLRNLHQMRKILMMKMLRLLGSVHPFCPRIISWLRHPLIYLWVLFFKNMVLRKRCAPPVVFKRKLEVVI